MNLSGSHYRSTLAVLIIAAVAAAHPLGNLSANRFTRIQPGDRRVAITEVLDLGEMPVFELMSAWHINRAALENTAREHVDDWIRNLSFRENGEDLRPELRSANFEISDSPGGLATMRVTLVLHLPARGGHFEFSDHNYPSRPGWREIVIVPGPGAEISRASNGSVDRSAELRRIPEEGSPLNETSAWMDWRRAPGLISQATPPVIAPSTSAGQTAAPVPATAAHPASSSSRGDAISSILRRKTISLPLFIVLLALAFWFGALHALEPGHGKTMVAAYLVGSRGTPKHAALLGLSVTFTHTISVFLLGIATLFISRYVMPERISRVLGIASGISIIWIGAMLLWRRMRLLRTSHAHDHNHAHHHGHVHEHAHAHVHSHAHDHHHHEAHDHDHHHADGHAHDHVHSHDHHDHGHAFTHTHDGHTHTHVPEGDISVRSLIALGASGGLVPCPSALILLLTAISLGRTGLGLILLCAFSAGLAIVLTATGLAVLYAKRLIPESRRTNHPAIRYMPVFSAAVIVIIGAVMTGVSLGWIPANRFTG